MSLNFSMGGDGGSGNDGGSVVVDNRQSIITAGAQSRGILAQSIGAGGGSGGAGIIGSDTLFDAASIASQVKLTRSWSIAIGGSSGASGSGSTVNVINSGDISTSGMESTAIFAQSVGGGGGVAEAFAKGEGSGGSAVTGVTGTFGLGGAGGAAGNGGNVNVLNTHQLNTVGDAAYGIFAQSVGGGGGKAGDLTRGLGFLGQNIGIGFAFGRAGGGAGNGGSVAVTNTSNITTLGTNASGIYAQSIGGGGGVGGGTGNDLAFHIFSGSVGGKGDGGNVAVNNTGNITTMGDSANGIFAQSVGGTNGSFALVNGSLTNIVVANGRAGAVDISVAGNVIANGTDANGVFAQSAGFEGAGNISITISNGTVQGGWGSGAGVRIADGANNTLINHGTISSLGGTAIIGGAGNETIHNYGTVTGSVDLGAGHNIFNNYGGATLNLGASGMLNLGVGNNLFNSGLLTGSGQVIGNVASAGTIDASNSTPNLLLDGGFELGLTTGPGTYNYLSTYGAWTTTQGTTAILGMPCAGMPPYEGTEAMHVGNAFGTGFVRQSFATTIGQKYGLSLAVVGWSGGSGTIQATVFNASNNTNLIANFAAPGGNVWGTNSYEFVATSALSTLQLQNVAGACTIDDVRVTPVLTNVVTLAAGNAAGSLTIDGSLSLLASANLLFDIGGRARGTSYDFLGVTNLMQFDGTLSLSLTSAFLPTSTDIFTLMIFGSSSGLFGNVLNGGRLTTLDNLETFQVLYTTNSLVVEDFEPVLVRVSIQRNASGQMILQFPGVSGHSYAIEYRSNPTSGAWTPVTSAVFTFPSPGLCQWVDDGTLTGGLGGTSRFYRIKQ